MRFAGLRRQLLRRGRRWQIRWRASRMPPDTEWPRPALSPLIAGLSPEQQQTAIAQVCGTIGAAPAGEIHSGIKRTAISIKLVQPDGTPGWLKITAKGGVTEEWRRQGERAAQIDGVPQPKILRELTLTHEDAPLHAFVYSFVPWLPVQPTPWVSRPMPDLDDRWVTALAQTLNSLSEQNLTRWHVRPGPVARMVGQRFGRRAPYDVDEWRMSHGDLHWSNLTAPTLSILDWEFYGAAPRGYDAAMLLMFSLNEPELYQRFERAFADELNTRSGLIARLFTIARRLKSIEEGKSDPRHHKRLEREARRLLRM